MQLSSKDDIYDVATLLMQLLGESMENTSRTIVLFRTVNCVILVFVLIFINANFVHAKGEMYVDTLESWISLNHILIKYLLFMYYKGDLRDILNIRSKYYWDYRDFNRKIVSAVGRTYNTIKSIEGVLLVLTFFLILMVFLQPLLYHNTVYLVKTWVFIESVVLETVVLTSHYYIYIFAMPIVFGYDIWYMTLCIDLIIQVRLMKHSLHEVSGKSLNNGTRQIGVIIRHHLMLLSIFRKMKRIYSIMMLFHYFVTLITACTDMYELLVGDTSIANCLLKIPTLLFIFGEFAYYAILAEQVSFEFSDLSDTIYMSRWYENGVAVQKLYLLIMVRSQRVEYFTGAGLMDINIDAFGSLVRKTFSFFTIIKNLLE